MKLNLEYFETNKRRRSLVQRWAIKLRCMWKVITTDRFVFAAATEPTGRGRHRSQDLTVITHALSTGKSGRVLIRVGQQIMANMRASEIVTSFKRSIHLN